MRREAARAEEVARSDLADRFRQGWAWWVDELRAMVPRALLVRSSDRAASIDCLFLPDGRIAFDLARAGRMPSASEAREPDEAAAARLAVLRDAARRPTVRLSVPRDICLSRRSVLPVRALAHAGAILRHEIEARMPIEPEGLLCDWYVETEDTGAGTLHVVQIALARSRIVRAEAAFAAAGLAMTHLTVGDAEARPVPVDLVGRHEPSLHAAFLGLPLAAKLLLAAALALALYAPFEAAGRLAGAADAMAETRAALPKAGPAAVSAAAVADSLEARATRFPLAALLDELSRRLPRAASVTRLDYRSETLMIGLTGTSGESAHGPCRQPDLLLRRRRAGRHAGARRGGSPRRRAGRTGDRTMIARLQNVPLVRRAGALALLAVAAWIVVPPLLGPLQGWRDGRIALEEESERLERAQRLAARRAAVVALADTTDAPFLVAPDAASATAGLAARVSGAAAGDAMRITVDASPVIDDRPGAPVALRYRFEATQGGLYAFLAEIESRPPFLRIDDLQAVPATAGDGSIGLSGGFAVSTVALLRPQP